MSAGRLLRLSVPRAVVPILLAPLIASFCQDADRAPHGARKCCAA
jgi:hypothetical protein